MTTPKNDSADRITSRWPLPAAGIRFIAPQFLLDTLSAHPLSRDLYPLAMGFYPRAAGHRMRRSSHTSHLLIYCVGGTGELRLGSKTMTVASGDVLILPPGIAHSYSAQPGDPWSIFWVHYQGELSGQFTEFLQLEQPLLSIGIQPRLLAEFDALLALRKGNLTVTHFVQAACRLKALLTEFACATVDTATGAGRGIDMDQLLQYMTRHIGSELDLDALAATANLSKYHFIRRFKERTGHTPIQHFIHIKMQHACQLLDGSDEPVKRIASAVGYDDPLYFSRLFKRVMGVSPQHYREHHSI